MKKFKYGAKSAKQEKFFENQFETVLSAIREMIESEDPSQVLEWERGWVNPRQARNFITGKNYTGLRNVGYLELVAQIRGYKTSQWAGSKQISEKGGKIRSGETGHPIFVPQMKKIEEKNPDIGLIEEKSVFIGWSIFHVFNADQQIGVEIDYSAEERRWSGDEDAEAIVDVVADYIDYREQDGAYYSARDDRIGLPLREQFRSASQFYGTLFHEAAHWTGADERLNRFTRDAVASFGSTNYSFEELVAEFSASMLKVRSGIDDGHANAAAYIKAWWKRLENNVDDLLRAYNKAIEATDYISQQIK